MLFIDLSTIAGIIAIIILITLMVIGLWFGLIAFIEFLKKLRENLMKKKLNGWHRLWIVLSVVWLFVAWAVAQYERIDEAGCFVLMVFPPIASYILGWGIVWIIKGFKPE